MKSCSARFIAVASLTVCSAVAAGFLFASGVPERSPQAQHEQLSALMLAKLASSQKIVAGLVSEDFEQIRKGADELNRVCEATSWAAHDDQIYAHHRTELKRQSLKLVKLADERNLDGAAFTYMQSLTTCISCHQYCRDILHIAADSPLTDKVVPIPVTDEPPQRISSPTRVR